jgi:hypothetical protein
VSDQESYQQKSSITVDENNIFHFDYHHSVDITLEDAMIEIAFCAEVGGGEMVAALVNITHAKSVNQEARKYYSSEDAERVYKAVALIVNSPVSKMLGNFFIGLNKPPMPLKLFNSEEEGVAWLKGFCS